MGRFAMVVGVLSLVFVPVAAQEPPVEGDVLLLSTDFESGADGWTLNGLWSVDGTPATMTGGAAYSGSQSLNYNNGVDYETGGANSGTARTPLLDLSAFHEHIVKFRCNYKTQTTGTSRDKRIVRILRDGQVILETTLRSSWWFTNPAGGRCASMGTWHVHEIRLPAMVRPGEPHIMIAHTLQVEFAFDTVDGQSNGYPGWFIEDLNVARLALPVSDDHGNTRATATEIAMGGPSVDTRPLDGRIETAGDVDFFKFRVPASLIAIWPAPTLTFEVRTLGLSSEMDTVIHLYNQNGDELASDDDGGDGLASLITRTVPMDGRIYYVKVRHFSGSGTGSYKISVMRLASPAADDHGNTPGTATLVQPNDPATAGVIETAGDVDFFQTPQLYFFMDPGPRNWTFETSDLSGGMDTVIDLYAADGTTLLASNDDAPGLGLASRITWVATAGTRFYIKVRHYSSTGTGSYKIRVLEQ